MIVNRLTICNMRNYVGPVDVDLSVSKSKNVILMGGLNGAGKTTFADSIRLCLYGHSIFGKVMSEAKYQEFLADFINNTENVREAYVSMKLTIDEENPQMDIDIKRSFTRIKNGFREELTLRKGGSSLDMIDENYWSYYIEKLIPPNVSRYFFFDGEKVKDIIASEDAKDYLLNAVKDLSGVSELENLRKDLIEVRKNIVAKTKKKADLEQIKSIQDKIDYHTSLIVDLDSRILDEQQSLTQLSSKRTDINSDLSRISGANESKKKLLEESLKELNSKYAEADEYVMEFCYNRMLYAAAVNSLQRTIAQAKSEDEEQINKYSVNVLESILMDGSADKILKLGKKESEQAISRLISNIQSRKKKEEKAVLEIPLSRISQMESLFVTKDELNSFQDIFESRESLEQDRKSLRKKIDKIDDESFSDYHAELKSIDEKIQEINSELAASSSEKESNANRIQELVRERTSAEHSIVLEDVDRASIDVIDQILESLRARMDSTISKARSSLIKKINSMYNVLKNNEDMVKEIRLTESCELQIYNFDDKQLKISGLSEGEKSILMYSAIYGLHSLSQLQFPLIIDSPIGRMDSIHSDHLAHKLYPVASNQLILLSHNREIVGALHDCLRPSIAREYLITKFGTPKISLGYFD